MSKCDDCQKAKPSQGAPPELMGRRIVDQPWSLVSADCMGHLPRSRSGNSYIVVFHDYFTKWVEIKALRAAKAKAICAALEDLVISRWGRPEVILTDNGTEFSNKLMKDVTSFYGIHHSTSPAYHPQANPTERVNRVIKTMLRAYVDKNQVEWDKNLHEFWFAINTAVNSSTKVSPAFLNFGREPRSSVNLRREDEGPLDISIPDRDKWTERMDCECNLHVHQ